jgi:hypothetical protein
MKSKSSLVLTAVLLSAFSLASARTLTVGPGKAYAKPSAASKAAITGDTILIDAGTYPSDEAIWRAGNLIIKGVSKYAWVTAPSVISNQKATWVIQGANTKVENIRFSGAKVPDRNGAGIRAEGNNLKVVNCYFHDNENGILGGGNAYSDVSVENSEFYNNGAGDGYSHNMYLGSIHSFTLKASNSRHAKVGHNVKSRAAVNYILYNRIMDESDGTASYEVDLPNGGNAYLIGNLIQQSQTTQNPNIVSFGEEGMSNANSALSVVNNTIVNDRTSGGTFVKFPSGFANVRAYNNLFVGNGSVLSGPAQTGGNVTSGSPGFVNRAAFDYHLTSASPAIDKGVNPGSYAGFDLTPRFQWSASTGSEARVVSGALDAGGYEYPKP